METRQKGAAFCWPKAWIFVLAVSVLAFAHSASAGWKEEWNGVMSKAKQEGKVVVFGAMGQTIRRAVTEGFTKAFPDISIEYTGARGGQHATRMAAERKGGIYRVDVVLTGTDSATIRIKPLKALDPLRPALILPEVTNLAKWRGHRLDFDDNHRLRGVVRGKETGRFCFNAN